MQFVIKCSLFFRKFVLNIVSHEVQAVYNSSLPSNAIYTQK